MCVYLTLLWEKNVFILGVTLPATSVSPSPAEAEVESAVLCVKFSTVYASRRGWLSRKINRLPLFLPKWLADGWSVGSPASSVGWLSGSFLGMPSGQP